MTADQELAQQMRREVRDQCVNCGAHPYHLTLNWHRNARPSEHIWTKCKACGCARYISAAEGERICMLIKTGGYE